MPYFQVEVDETITRRARYTIRAPHAGAARDKASHDSYNKSVIVSKEFISEETRASRYVASSVVAIEKPKG